MKNQERQAAIEVQAAAFPNLAPPSTVPVGERLGLGLRPGHQRLSSPLATPAICVMKSRIAFNSAGSGSPVHSSMKNFLNSSAIAQPWPGYRSWTNRVCSPLPWKATFSRTSRLRPLKSNRLISSIRGSSRKAQSIARHREGSDIDVGSVRLWRGLRIGAAAPMIVAVGVDEHETALAPQRCRPANRQAFDNRLRGWRAISRRAPVSAVPPDLEPPTLVRGHVDGCLAGRLRSNSKRERWTIRCVGTPVTACPVNGSSSRRRSGSASSCCGDIRPKVVSVMDRGREHGTGAAAHSPPAFWRGCNCSWKYNRLNPLSVAWRPLVLRRSPEV